MEGERGETECGEGGEDLAAKVVGGGWDGRGEGGEDDGGDEDGGAGEDGVGVDPPAQRVSEGDEDGRRAYQNLCAQSLR